MPHRKLDGSCSICLAKALERRIQDPARAIISAEDL